MPTRTPPTAGRPHDWGEPFDWSDFFRRLVVLEPSDHLGVNLPAVDGPIPSFDDDSDGGSARRRCARALFLERFNALAPDAIEELRGIAQRDVDEPEPPLRDASKEVLLCLPLRNPMRVGSGVEAWVRRWSVDSTWFFVQGIRGVVHLARGDAWPESWLRTQLLAPPEEGAGPQLEIPPPDPQSGSRAAEWDRAVAALKEEFDAVWSSRVRGAVASGGDSIRSRPSLMEHVEWLVRYQVRHETFTGIARDELPVNPEETGRKTVADAVRRVAAWVGLRLRPPHSGGRPPG